jgi:hypothetical protein
MSARVEDNIQRTIVSYFERALPKEAVFMAIPNGAFLAGNAERRARQMKRLKDAGLRIGAADLHICHKGKSLYIEVKAPKGKQQVTQTIFQDDVSAAGGIYTVARSVEEVEAFLEAQGVALRCRVRV